MAVVVFYVCSDLCEKNWCLKEFSYYISYLIRSIFMCRFKLLKLEILYLVSYSLIFSHVVIFNCVCHFFFIVIMYCFYCCFIIFLYFLYKLCYVVFTSPDHVQPFQCQKTAILDTCYDLLHILSLIARKYINNF